MAEMKLTEELKAATKKFDSRGNLVLTEADLGALTDDMLRGVRREFVEKQRELQEEFIAIGEDRFNNAVGLELFRDIQYYDGLIRRVEAEMQYRLLTLDSITS